MFNRFSPQNNLEIIKLLEVKDRGISLGKEKYVTNQIKKLEGKTSRTRKKTYSQRKSESVGYMLLNNFFLTLWDSPTCTTLISKQYVLKKWASKDKDINNPEQNKPRGITKVNVAMDWRNKSLKINVKFSILVWLFLRGNFTKRPLNLHDHLT